MNKKFIKGLREVAQNYTSFLIDLWGVVHDGATLFTEAKNCLLRLDQLGKQIVFLTNSPRPGAVLAQHLCEMGLSLKQTTVYSSGDETIRFVREKFFGARCYFMGESFHSSLQGALDVAFVPSVETADFILLSGISPTTEENLKKGLENRKPLVCANPDQYVRWENQKKSCPGLMAADYEKKGGTVFYIGKPHAAVYASAMRILKKEKGKTLAIGDGIFTDLLGAKEFGVEALFIKDGLFFDHTEQQLQKMLDLYALSPKYQMNRLMW